MTFKPSKLATITDSGKSIPGELIVGLGRFFTELFWPELRKLVSRHSKKIPGILSSIDERTPRGKPPLWTSFCRTLVSEPFMIAKSSPVGKDGKVSTSFNSICDAAATWKSPNFRVLYEHLREWCIHTGNFKSELVSGSARLKTTSVWDGLQECAGVGTPQPFLGKLALKREAAGKIRVFALVDCFTQ